MKITDLRCAIIGGQPVIRIKTDEGIDGYGSAARLRSAHIRWHVESLGVGNRPASSILYR